MLDEHDILLGHTAGVNGTLELRDGRLLSWSSDHTLLLWGADGDPLTTLLGGTLSVYRALELSDGRLLSWGHEDALRLWDSEGEELALLEGHTWCVEGALEVADGNRILCTAATALCVCGMVWQPKPRSSMVTPERCVAYDH